MIEHIKCSTPDFAVENAKKLLALFPECEGQKGEVDIDKLREELPTSLWLDVVATARGE